MSVEMERMQNYVYAQRDSARKCIAREEAIMFFYMAYGAMMFACNYLSEEENEQVEPWWDDKMWNEFHSIINSKERD